MPYQRRLSIRERLQDRIIERRRDARQVLHAEFGPPWWIPPGKSDLLRAKAAGMPVLEIKLGDMLALPDLVGYPDAKENT